MISNITYKPLKEPTIIYNKKKKKVSINNTINSKDYKSTNLKFYIKKSNINPILKFIYLYL